MRLGGEAAGAENYSTLPPAAHEAAYKKIPARFPARAQFVSFNFKIDESLGKINNILSGSDAWPQQPP
jgi:hypothetical protein